MKPIKGAFLYGQSGGPTAVINNSFLGALEEVFKHPELITGVYGARHGILGILEDDIIDITQEDPAELARLKTTPAAVLGSVRHKLKEPEENEDEYKKILETFKKYNIRYFFYNGGNDSMDTCYKISCYLNSVNYSCCVIGVPKTIDNDLAGTDHCPGYGSAAKYVATSCMEVARDCQVYNKGSVVVIEIMGRNAGWLTAAAALANLDGSNSVDLIYLPEIAFDMDKYTTDLKEKFKTHKNIVVAVSEGIKDAQGRYVADYWKNMNVNATDGFNHVQLGGVGSYLAEAAKHTLKDIKVRSIELNLLQRCAAHISSKTDADEAYMAGQFAVKQAVSGKSGGVVAFKRTSKPSYLCTPVLIPLAIAANNERFMPAEYISKEKNYVTEKFFNYVMPLVQGENIPSFENGLPRYAKLKLVKTK